MTTTVNTAEARARLSALIEAVHSTAERVTITRNGAPVAVLISPDDLEALEETLFWLNQSERVKAAVAADREEWQSGPMTSAAEMAALVAARARASA